MQNINNFLACFTWGFFFLLGVQFGMHYEGSKQTTPEIIARPTPPQEQKPIELNRCNLLAELKKQGVHYPHIVFAQSMIETGNLSSFICKERNNLFGMHNPTVRKSKTIAKKGEKYAKFDTWQDAVKDLKLWQAMHELNGQEFTDAEYIAFLRTSGYIAGAAEYYEELILKIKLPECYE